MLPNGADVESGGTGRGGIFSPGGRKVMDRVPHRHTERPLANMRGRTRISLWLRFRGMSRQKREGKTEQTVFPVGVLCVCDRGIVKQRESTLRVGFM